MRRRWVFWAVAAALTVLWIVANLPRAEEDAEPNASYTTRRAGWPDRFARWSVRTDSGETFYSSFDAGALLFNVVVLAAPITAAWFLTRPPRPTPDETPTKPRHSTPGKVSTRRPRT